MGRSYESGSGMVNTACHVAGGGVSCLRARWRTIMLEDTRHLYNEPRSHSLESAHLQHSVFRGLRGELIYVGHRHAFFIAIGHNFPSIDCQMVGLKEMCIDGQGAAENMGFLAMWSGAHAGMSNKKGVHGVRLTIKANSWDRLSASTRREEVQRDIRAIDSSDGRDGSEAAARRLGWK